MFDSFLIAAAQQTEFMRTRPAGGDQSRRHASRLMVSKNTARFLPGFIGRWAQWHLHGLGSPQVLMQATVRGAPVR